MKYGNALLSSRHESTNGLRHNDLLCERRSLSADERIDVAQHTIDFDIPAQTLGNVDVTCHAYSDGTKIGTLRLSKGTVDWTPARNSVNFKRFSWERFADLLERGTIPRTQRKSSTRKRKTVRKRRRRA